MGRDVELHLEKIHGPSSWEARLDKTWYAPHSETVLFRTRADSSFEQGDVLIDFPRGLVIRGDTMARFRNPSRNTREVPVQAYLLFR